MSGQIIGVWRPAEAVGTDTGTSSVDGLLTFTADGHVSVAVVRTDLPRIGSGDRMSATTSENRTIVQGSLGYYGTYEAGDDGALRVLHVAGSTDPALAGRDLGAEAATFSVDGELLVLAAHEPALSILATTWRRVGGPAGAPGLNRVAGAWRVRAARATAGTETVELFGPDPGGSLIFADSLYFTDVLHRSDVGPFASGDRRRGTDEEYLRVMQGSLLVFGRYGVDDDGAFRDEVVLGSSMPNWAGMARDRSRLTETVDGDRMVERLDDHDGAVVEIEFTRAPST